MSHFGPRRHHTKEFPGYKTLDALDTEWAALKCGGGISDSVQESLDEEWRAVQTQLAKMKSSDTVYVTKRGDGVFETVDEGYLDELQDAPNHDWRARSALMNTRLINKDDDPYANACATSKLTHRQKKTKEEDAV